MNIDGKDKKPAIKKGISQSGNKGLPTIRHNPLEMRRVGRLETMFFCKTNKSNKKNKS